jgi:hypothetical protein
MADEPGSNAGASNAPGSPFGGLPAWTPRPETYEEYLCEGCLKPSRYTRLYSLHYLFFGLLFFTQWSKTYARCPGCMRRRIAWGLLPALLLANFLSPLVLVWWGGTFARTFSRLPHDDGR